MNLISVNPEVLAKQRESGRPSVGPWPLPKLLPDQLIERLNRSSFISHGIKKGSQVFERVSFDVDPCALPVSEK
jgi:hypothetical protein